MFVSHWIAHLQTMNVSVFYRIYILQGEHPVKRAKSKPVTVERVLTKKRYSEKSNSEFRATQSNTSLGLFDCSDHVKSKNS